MVPPGGLGWGYSSGLPGPPQHSWPHINSPRPSYWHSKFSSPLSGSLGRGVPMGAHWSPKPSTLQLTPCHSAFPSPSYTDLFIYIFWLTNQRTDGPTDKWTDHVVLAGGMANKYSRRRWLGYFQANNGLSLLWTVSLQISKKCNWGHLSLFSSEHTDNHMVSNRDLSQWQNWSECDF